MFYNGRKACKEHLRQAADYSNLFVPHFIDGAEVPPEYQERITTLIEAACEAEEVCTVEELERSES